MPAASSCVLCVLPAVRTACLTFSWRILLCLCLNCICSGFRVNVTTLSHYFLPSVLWLLLGMCTGWPTSFITSYLLLFWGSYKLVAIICYCNNLWITSKESLFCVCANLLLIETNAVVFMPRFRLSAKPPVESLGLAKYYCLSPSLTLAQTILNDSHA